MFIVVAVVAAVIIIIPVRLFELLGRQVKSSLVGVENFSLSCFC